MGKGGAQTMTQGEYQRTRPEADLGQDHCCRSAASQYLTFMAPRSIIQGPEVR